MNRQKLTGILKRAGLKPSKWHASGQVRGWGHSSEGYKLTVVETNERYAQLGTPQRPRWGKVGSDIVGFILTYYTRHALTVSSEMLEAQKQAGMDRMKAALRDAGVPFEEKDGGLFVPA